MVIIRESNDPGAKFPSSPFWSNDIPANSTILLDDINEVVIILKPLYGFDIVIEIITYDEYDKNKGVI